MVHENWIENMILGIKQQPKMQRINAHKWKEKKILENKKKIFCKYCNNDDDDEDDHHGIKPKVCTKIWRKWQWTEKHF